MNHDTSRREVGRLIADRDCSKVSTTMMTIANDYANYRYEMNAGMAVSLLKLLKSQPRYEVQL